MNQERKSWPAYLFLVLILVLAVGLFLFSPPLADKRRLIILALSAAYFIWGIVYHYRRGNLVVKVALEYLLIAVLGAVLLFSLT